LRIQPVGLLRMLDLRRRADPPGEPRFPTQTIVRISAEADYLRLALAKVIPRKGPELREIGFVLKALIPTERS
jgi:hypothetical protein